jgi:triacylglycerol lipase
MLAGTSPRLPGLPDAVSGLARTAERARGVAVEAGWVTAHLLMYPMGLRADAGSVPARHDLAGLSPSQRGLMHHGVDLAATPILLVHGIIDNHSVFSMMGRALSRRGFCNISSFDYGPFTRDVRRAAVDLAGAVERLVDQSGYDKVHLVGHSLGGLIARYYVQRMGGDAAVATLVTMGTPHAGTTLARSRAGALLPIVSQLRPESDLIQELAQPAPACTTRFVAFYSDLDHVVTPASAARVDHPDLHATNHQVRGVGHLSMPHSGRVAFEIAARLRSVEDGTVDSPGPAGGTHAR